MSLANFTLFAFTTLKYVGWALAAAQQCPDGWAYSGVYFNCLRVFRDEPKSWADARHYCEKESANLVSIRNAFEQAAVSGLLADVGSCSGFWLNAKYDDDQHVFRWLEDNHELVYRNFGR
ncbi:Macrophage mannose receptor 1, partial [Aphelenchoides avenae]